MQARTQGGMGGGGREERRRGGGPPLRYGNKFILSTTENMPSPMLCPKLEARILIPLILFHLILSFATLDFIKWHTYQALSVGSQLVVTFEQTLKHLHQPGCLTQLDLTPPLVSTFPVTLFSTFPTEAKSIVLLVRNLLHIHKPVTDQSTTIRLQNLPNLPFFPIRTYYNIGTKTTLEKIPEAISNLQDRYLRKISNVNLSTTQIPKILFKRDSSFSAQTGLSTMGNRSFTNTLQG